MINLTASHDPGDKYSGAGPYTHVAVTKIFRDDSAAKLLVLEVAFGSDSGGFVENTDGYPAASETFGGADYDTYQALATNDPETIGAAQDRCREQCLIDLARYPGTLV